MEPDENEIDVHSGGSENRTGSYFEEPNVVLIKEFDQSPESSSYSDSSDDEESITKKEKKNSNEVASVFSHIQKLIRYLRTGNQTATIVALSCLKDEDLESDVIQEAIKKTEGLQILANLLETKDRKCKMATLLILKSITTNADIVRKITDIGAIPDIINILDDEVRTLQKLAAEIVANISKLKKPRKIVRKTGGLPKLVHLLKISEHLLKTKKLDLNSKEQEIVDVVCASCNALWAVSHSYKSKIEIFELNAVKHFAQLLRSCHEEIIVATLGAITQCATQSDFQISLQKEGIIEDIVKYLTNESDEIKKHCAVIIFECAENSVTNNLIRQYGGLDPLISLLTNEKTCRNKTLLASVTGAVWKCSYNSTNIRRLDELDTVTILIQLLNYENEEVLTNVAGALAECVKLSHNHEIILKNDGIPAIVNLLNYTNENLLENVARILAQCAKNVECIEQIVQNDGIRLLWSLLRNSSPSVQASAAWALVPCFQNAIDSVEMIRSFAGGLELLISLLESNDVRVLSCVCATIAEVARNEENLAVITDLDVVTYLAKLVPMKDETLRENLSIAIANCCAWKSNCYHFGQLNAVKSLVSYMNSNNIKVQRATALALYKLSTDPYNCVTLHRSGIVKLLLQTIASKDEQLQEYSAGCISNIRSLALKLSSKP